MEGLQGPRSAAEQVSHANRVCASARDFSQAPRRLPNSRTAAAAAAAAPEHPLPRSLQAIEYLLNRNFLLTALELVQEAGEAGLAHEVEHLMCEGGGRGGPALSVGWRVAAGWDRQRLPCCID